MHRPAQLAWSFELGLQVGALELVVTLEVGLEVGALEFVVPQMLLMLFQMFEAGFVGDHLPLCWIC
jgi:hypothetical protein